MKKAEEEARNKAMSTRVSDAGVRKIFNFLDEDNSGTLGKDEIAKLAALCGKKLVKTTAFGFRKVSKELDKAFEEMDSNNNGEVSVREFLLWYRRAVPESAGDLKAQSQFWFNTLDVDKSGTIEIGEFKVLVKNMGLKLKGKKLMQTFKDIIADKGGQTEHNKGKYRDRITFEEFHDWRVRRAEECASENSKEARLFAHVKEARDDAVKAVAALEKEEEKLKTNVAAAQHAVWDGDDKELDDDTMDMLEDKLESCENALKVRFVVAV